MANFSKSAVSSIKPVKGMAAACQTTVEKKSRIEEIGRIYSDLLREQVVLQLEVEAEEDRADSLKANWCRAWLDGNMPECERLLAQMYPQVAP